MTTTRTSPRWMWALIILAPLTASCGNLTAGGFGEANVVVSGDEPSPSPQPSTAPSAVSSPAATSHDQPEGDVGVELSAYIVDEGGTARRLGANQLVASVDIGGVTSDEVAEQTIPVTQYVEVRLVFTEVTANVLSGLPVLGAVSVDIGSDLSISRPIALDLREGAEVDVVIDLNAPTWLLTVNPITRVVDAAAFESLVEVSIQ